MRTNPMFSRYLCRYVALAFCLIAAAWVVAVEPVPPSSQSQHRVAVAYRQFYPAFARFHEHEKAAHYPLLRIRLRIWPKTPDESLDELVLQLASASVSYKLNVNLIGGVDLPLSKVAFDEDAVLGLNRPQDSYLFSTQYSIEIRKDGLYSSDWLQAACRQGFALKRSWGLSHRLAVMGKSCVGVTFRFRHAGDRSPVMFRDRDGMLRPMQSMRVPFSGQNRSLHFSAVSYRFAEWPPQGQLIASVQPDLIDFIYE